MTEPHAGADPTLFTTQAVRDGDEWVINGWKFFSSNARTASFLIVMVVTNPDVSAYQGMSMFLVPTDTPGVNIVRNVGLHGEPRGRGLARAHPLRQRAGAADALLGGEGQAFAIAQTRLGGGRIHHAMRTIGMAQQGARHDVRAGAEPRDAGQPAGRQAVRAGLHRRLVRPARCSSGCWCSTPRGRSTSTTTTSKVRKDIAAVKVVMPTVLHDIAWRAMQVHGALGVTNEMPFIGMVTRRRA